MVEDDVKVSHAAEFGHVHLLILFAYPVLAQAHAAAVHRVITILVQKVHGITVRELLVIDVGDGCGSANPIETVNLDSRGGEACCEVLRVLPHVPTVLKADVAEEAAVVLVSVVEGRRGDKDMILRPRLLGWNHPGVRGGHALLLADLDGGHKRDAIIIT